MPSTSKIPHNRAALLNYILLFFGTALILAAIIFFFAFNWDSLPKLGKLGIIQVGFVASCLAATLTQKNTVLSQTLLFAAATLVGVFLAVFGQIYQTGADPWQLFTLWAALILPFALIANNQPQWLAFATVAALGTGRLLYYFVPQYELFEPLGFTLQILVPTLFFAAIWLKFERSHQIHNQPRPWSRPLLAFILFATITAGITITTHGQSESSTFLAGLSFYTLLIAATAAIWKFFARPTPDITTLGIAAIAWLLATSWTIGFLLVSIELDPILIFFFMAAYFITASSALVFALRHLTPKKPVSTPDPVSNPVPPTPASATPASATPAPSRILPILSGVGGWFASLFFIAASLLVIGFDNAESTQFGLAITLSIIAFAVEFAIRTTTPPRDSTFLEQAITPLSLTAQWLVGFTLLENNTLLTQILGIALVCGIHYVAIRSATLRFLTTLTFIAATYLFASDFSDLSSLPYILTACTLTTGLVFTAFPYIRTTITNFLIPAAYAATLAAFIILWTQPFHVTLTLTTITAIALIALALATFENRHNPNATRLLITALLLAALSFYSNINILWAITILSIALWRQRTALTTTGVLGFAISLTVYYYKLHVTLLTKSAILLASGLLFLALFWFLELNKNTTNPSPEVTP